MFEGNLLLPPINSPHPPRNFFLEYSHQRKNSYELVWDDPSVDINNRDFDIAGVNIYRTYASELGNYTKINDEPITVGYYLDSMEHKVITEDVSNKFLYRGNGPKLEWVFETEHRIVKDDIRLLYANTSSDVEVRIDGVLVPIYKVDGFYKSVQLITEPYLDKLTRQLHQPILPSPDSVVTCTYRYNSNYIEVNKNTGRIFYKLTTVLKDGTESSLTHSPPTSPHQIEAWDFIWKEATRRNRWILQQGGEDCWIRLRKWFGEPCPCYSKVHERAKVDCESCWGTGIVGGYEGPFPFLMAPIDAETRLDRVEQGLHVNKTSVLWSNVLPRLHTFDLIYRKNGEIYVVGYVKQSEVRGNSFLQQEFNASLLSRDRIEYKIPYVLKDHKVFVTEKLNIPDSQEVRGRTVTFENLSY